MKTEVIDKPTERSLNDTKNQMVINNLANSEAIVNVTRGDDGKYLCLTDNRGVKLHVRLDQKSLKFVDSNPDMILDRSYLFAHPYPHCSTCECVYREIASQRICFNPVTNEFCNC